MRVRFEFRKSRSEKKTVVGNPDKQPDYDGIIRVYILIGATPDLTTYGPYSTGIRTTQAKWDSREESAITDPLSLASELIAYRNTLYGAAERLQAQGLPLTGLLLIEHRIPRTLRAPMSLLGAFEWYLSNRRLQVYHNKQTAQPDQISPQTFYRYGTRMNAFKDYLAQSGQNGFLLLQCDISFVRGWQRWATKRGLQLAYRSKCIALLKTIVKEACMEKIIAADGLNGLRLSHPVETAVLNLTDEEISALRLAAFTDERYAQVRDAFMLAMELCVHYADYVALKDAYFVRDGKGALWLEKPREKSPGGKEVQHVPVSEYAHSLMEKYKTIAKLPRKALSAFNRDLKMVSQIADLKRKGKHIPLSFSHARDASIGRMVRAKRSEISICAVAGWTSAKYLRRYAVIDRDAV